MEDGKKVKIKLSELIDLYDIEDDTVAKEEVKETLHNEDVEFDVQIKASDKKLEEEFEEQW